VVLLRVKLLLQDVEPEADYILVIDADMIFRSAFIPEKLGLRPGAHWLISCPVIYTKT
jgi:hypothetical protein